ncbi:unnamed protein product [Discula destructiva]
MEAAAMKTSSPGNSSDSISAVTPSWTRSIDTFPLLSGKKRDISWRPVQNANIRHISETSSSGDLSETISIPWLLPIHSISKAVTWSNKTSSWMHYSTQTPSSNCSRNTTTAWTPYLSSTANSSVNGVTADSVLPTSTENGFSAQSVKKTTGNASSFLLITVTNTLTIATSDLVTSSTYHHQTNLSSESGKESGPLTSPSWPSVSPTSIYSTDHSPTVQVATQNISFTTNPLTSSFQSSSLASYLVSSTDIGDQSAEPVKATTTGLIAGTSIPISGGSKPFAGSLELLVLAILAGALLV